MKKPSMILTADVLDNQRCEAPDCRGPLDHPELFLHSSCHPEAPVWALYTKADHTLMLTCAECDKEVATLLIGVRQ